MANWCEYISKTMIVCDLMSAKKHEKKRNIHHTRSSLVLTMFLSFYCGSFHSHYFFLLFSFSKLSVFTNLRSLVNVCFISWWNASTKTKKKHWSWATRWQCIHARMCRQRAWYRRMKTMFSEKQEKREEEKNRKQAKWLTQLIYCLLMAANCSSFFQFFGRFNDY